MIAFAVKTSLLLIVAAIATASMRRSSAASRHVVWSCALLAVLGLPIASALMPALPLPWLPPSTAELAVVQTSQFQQLEIATPAAPTRPTRPRPWLTFVWGAGAFVVLLRLVVGLWRRAQLARRCAELTESPLCEAVRAYATSMGIVRRVRILIAPAEMMPATWGLLRPTVLLPPSAHQWENDRLRLVLVHELSHVLRFDTLTAAIAYLATALAWWNPLVWFGARRAQLERERACDDAVLRSGLAPSRYAEELLAIARSLPSPFAQRLALAMARPRGITRRLDAILDGRQRRTGTSHTVAIAASLLLAAQYPLAAAQLVSRPVTQSTQNHDSARAGAPLATAPDVIAPRPAPVASHFVGVAQPPASAPAPQALGPQSIPAGQFGAGAYRPGNGVTNPIRIREVKPVYTEAALKAGLQGTVELEAVVSADGTVTDVRVVRSLDDKLGLDENAKAVVQRTPFVPCTIGDTPVACLVVFELQFTPGPPAPIAAGQFGAGAYRPGHGVTNPIRKNPVQPVYTKAAMDAKIEGTVELEAVIGTDGAVTDVRVVRSLDDTFGLDENAKDAVRRTSFVPCQIGATPVACLVVFELQFTLR